MNPCDDPGLLASLRSFRAVMYATFLRRADALFELTDALLCQGMVGSLAHLSLDAVHRRGWGSLYDALAAGHISATAVGDLLAAHPLLDGAPIYAVDASVWARCDAETSPQRGLYYHPARHSAGQPIVAGWAYQWIAQLSFARDSWTAPLSVRRLDPHDNPKRVAAEQIVAVCQRREPGGDALPIFVCDAGYDPVQLAQAVDAAGQTHAALLVRLRAGRCFYADPAPEEQPATGRPRRHGHKFACADLATWLPPSDEYAGEDAQYGLVRVRAWADLHPKPQEHATRGTRAPRPLVRGTLILVEVSRLPRPTQPPQQLWLWWHGSQPPDLAIVWRAYVHRFDLEHTFRFLKQTLNWTAPRVRHPEQADRWTWLVVLAYTQLRLARAVVADQRLPWERHLSPGKLTPARVRRAFPSLLLRLGTPASAPKPCGRSPGRPKGRKSGPATRYPAVHKAAEAA